MHALSGVGVALITPFTSDFSVDYRALERIINFQIDNGVDYLVSLGTTGEVATLSNEEQAEILQFTITKTEGRVPVVVGIGGNDTASIIQKIKTASLDGVTAILSVSPYYSKPSQEGIYQHYAAIARSTTLPIILYNVPGRTSSNINAETAIRLATDFSNIIGIKEASGNMVQGMHLVRQRPEGFLLISGDDHVTLPLIACGFDGVISVVANSFPAAFCKLVHLALAQNFGESAKIQTELLLQMDMLFIENNPAGVKAFLAEMGIIENYFRLPLVPLSEAIHQQVKTYLTAYN